MRDEILSPMISIASGGGPIHATPAAIERAREVGVLGEEAVARVHAVRAGGAHRVEYRLGVEVALGRGLAAERVGLVRVANVFGVAVEVGVHGDGRDPELATRAHHADRDLTSVRDQDLREQCIPYALWRPAIRVEGGRILRLVNVGACHLERRASRRHPLPRCPVVRLDRLDESLPARSRTGGRAGGHGRRRRRADGGSRPPRPVVDRAAGCVAPRLDAPSARARARGAVVGDDGRGPRLHRRRSASSAASKPVSSGRTTWWSTTASSPGSWPRRMPTPSWSAWAATCTGTRSPRSSRRSRRRAIAAPTV